MSEYLTKEEIKQWRSSLEKITLEEFARRLGKEVEGAKKTHDIVDMYVNKEPISTTIMPEVIKKPETKRVSRLVDEVTKSDDEVATKKITTTKADTPAPKPVPKKAPEVKPEPPQPQKAEKPQSELTKEPAKKPTQPATAVVEEKEQPKETTQEIKKEKPAKATAQKSKEAELTYKEFVLLKKLTDREILVLDSLIDSNGQSVKAQELAEKLDIPRDYIYKYIKNLRKKLQNATIGNSEEGGFVIEKP